MSSAFRTLALLGAVLSLSFGLTIAAPADARTHHTKTHAKKKKSRSGSSMLRTTQNHLANLGYYHGKVDGLNGPKTKAAIRKFQGDHNMAATGKLTTQTYNTILAADESGARHLATGKSPHYSSSRRGSYLPAPSVETYREPVDFYGSRPDYYGYYDQQYENAVQLGSPQTLPSRFAKIELAENGQPPAGRYNISLNDQPLVNADNQPSIIGVSRTFQLGPEDAIVLTAYQDGDTTCPYKHYLLALREGGYGTNEISNCTREFTTQVKDGSLFVTFPETDSGRAVGSIWRYESGNLEKL
ncbi:MAG: peptidoglycan-binding domain-containing protein [Alphaproteobacteria bacterium]|nr:peptidoglycan-binding domain-containing protein [Alphaproteobacteria bacterium]